MKTQTQTQTAGPWVCVSGAVQTATGTPIAAMDREPGNGTEPVERDANAALIASAPELLEALREMLAVSLQVDDLAWADAVGKGKGTGPCDKARQAIAKAEGGQA